MAIDESSFTNIIGEEVTRTSIVQQMIDYYNLKLEVGETKVTDFNEGSEIRNQLEAYAVDGYACREEQMQLSSVAFIETAEGEWLDKHGAEPYINLERNVGTIATGFVTFTLSNASETEITIPIETILTCTDNDLDYSTDSEIKINAGETTSGLVSVSCLVDGYDGNCPANTITIISDDNVNIPNLSVTNPSALEGGVDYEEDDEYRERLLNYIQRPSFGSYDYYVGLAEEITGVHDVLLVDEIGKTAKILINGDTKPTPTSVISDVTEAFSIPMNIVFGHTFSYDKPSYLESKLKVTCTTSQEIEDTDISSLLQALFDGGSASSSSLSGVELEGLSIGETLTKDSVDSTLDLLDDMVSFTVEVKYKTGGTWDSDWATFTDKTPSTNQVLQLVDVTIVQTVQT